jgi:hypothetical protein
MSHGSPRTGRQHPALAGPAAMDCVLARAPDLIRNDSLTPGGFTARGSATNRF